MAPPFHWKALPPLQVAHEVNGHLNREVEALTQKMEAMQQEREALTSHIKFLAGKVAEERRRAAVRLVSKAWRPGMSVCFARTQSACCCKCELW